MTYVLIIIYCAVPGKCQAAEWPAVFDSVPACARTGNEAASELREITWPFTCTRKSDPSRPKVPLSVVAKMRGEL